MELVAKDSEEFVNIAVRLLTNHSYQQELSNKIFDLFHRENENSDELAGLHKNWKVSAEWANFFKLLMGRKK